MKVPNPFSLPVHPPLVHFPVALLALAWGCLVLRYMTGDLRWDARARMLQIAGVISLPVVMVAALIDTRGFGFAVHAKWGAPLIWHALTGLVVATLATTHMLWRRRYPAEQMTGSIAVRDMVMASTTLWLLIAIGLIAAEMVFAS
jgi:uncharacterized membrane protein